MKIVGIGDLFIPAKFIEKGFEGFGGGKLELTTIDWTQRNLDELQKINLQVEQGGSEAYEVDDFVIEAVKDADIVILAVKPWLVNAVLEAITLNNNQILVSIAAGVSIETLRSYTKNEMPIFRLIPNTAISQMESMTFVTSGNASPAQQELIMNIFNEMGLAMAITEDKMGAATALASCGIAYALKYIQAGMQAGIEMGIYPKDAMTMVAQSMKGAAELILNNDTHPAVEIDKVCTPGGITIKGINELEHNGFSSAIIQAMKASNK